MSEENKKKEKDDYKLKRFGRYLILDHLVDGGIGRICRARFLGEQADKIVAVKMVLPQFSKDESFKKMFMDEIKVTFSLIHPNIAQTYDYGMVDEQLFSAMEYVDGKNLKQYQDRLKDKGFVFPVEICVYIISQTCQALTYAHNFQDKLTGKKLNIIHRDISPHNIMLTYDGTVKVIDFGIAKAETNSEATQAGTIKGKLSYLAPEYLEGHELDGRYDQFAVGITLWELLCSRKLFTAPNELATLKQIQACKVPPPSSINPNVPKELDLIVLKSLAKDRNLRYKNMEQFNRALVKFLYSQYPDFNATDLSYFASELYKEEIEKDRKKFQEFGKIDITPFLNELKNASVAPPPPGGEAFQGPTILDFGTDEKGRAKIDEANDLSLDVGGKGKPKLKSKTKANIKNPIKDKNSPSNRAEPKIAQATTNKESPSEIANEKNTAESQNSNKKTVPKRDRTKTRTRRKSLEQQPKDVSTNETQSKKKKSSLVPKIAIAASVAVIIYVFIGDSSREKVGFKNNNIVVETSKSDRIPSSNQKNKNESDGQIQEDVDIDFGILSLENLSPYKRVYINGELKDYSGLGIKLELNKKYQLKVEETDRAPFIKEFSLTPDQKSLIIRVDDMPILLHGELYSGLNFQEGTTVDIRGEYFQKEGIALPLKTGLRLPVGTYEAIITNPLYNTKTKVTFEIEENRRTKLPE